MLGRSRVGVTVLGGILVVPGAALLFARGSHDDGGAPPWQLAAPIYYAHVALPSTAPPDGALVDVMQAADPRRQGEQVSFQYDGFSVDLCTRSVVRSDPAACDPQPGDDDTVVRTVTEGEYVTSVRAYGKFGEAAAGPAADAVALFTSAQMTPNPGWFRHYAVESHEEVTR